MRILWVRAPKSGGSWFKKVRIDGWLRSIRNSDVRCLELGFDTTGGSRFSAVIGKNEFEELAREMINADPEFAIRAFGAAMQDFNAAGSSQTPLKLIA